MTSHLTLEGFLQLSLIHQIQVATLGVIVGGAIYWIIDSKVLGSKEAETKAKDEYEKALLESYIDIEEPAQYTMENADLDKQLAAIDTYLEARTREVTA